jgi:predicted DNA binding CopG/RHH family protein
MSPSNKRLKQRRNLGRGDMTDYRNVDEESDAWDRGEIGSSAEHLKAAPKELEAEIEEAMGLQPITLRLQKPLIAELKKIARENGLGYQPFVRQLLTQYVRDHRKTATV